MKKLNYPIIISDFDGTLANSQHQIPQNVVNAINEYGSAGGIFTVVSGRMPVSVLPHVRALKLKGLVAGYQGSVVLDIESGKIIKDSGLTPAQATEVCAVFNELNAPCNVYCGDTLYSERTQDDEFLRLYCDITRVKAITLPSAVQFFQKNDKKCHKVTSLVAPEERDKLFEAVKAKLGDKYDVTYSAEILVEVSPKNDNKGAALAFIAKKYGVPIEKTVAVGDSLNDLSMILAAGVGVAVGNAEPILKQHADVVTVTNDCGAIAKVIEEYGFEQD